ncbi:MarR family transcriptional regulator [Cohnella lubricantis]|uniref:MarR family transcriptional regulator n=1 Tax=Cohnella lubricantis TaxID=2163172 RepID=A0A841TFB3_9BACL|nr:MarR family transcriptional regulator [Cohnella lubricantis]MBB6677161.1 MarR family transcriptional regulator [Cohnella lubricantis]MBP2117028.1 DNA-binding MarR family transcriptional regulator [Cohnella lubricantis]
MADREQVTRIFRSFREVNQTFHHAIWKEAEVLGLTPIQYFVLKTLHEKPRVRLSQLAESIHIGSSAASGIVDRLVKLGTIKRERLETDRRSITLMLTEKGEELLRRASDTSMDRIAPLLDLKEEDVSEMIRIHQLIVQKLLEVERG